MIFCTNSSDYKESYKAGGEIDMNKKKMWIAGIVVGVFVVGSVIFGVNHARKQGDIEQPEDKGVFATLNFEYGENLEGRDEWEVEVDGETVRVKVENIDTKKVGNVEYPAETDKGEKTVAVNVTDTQKPTIEAEDKYEAEYKEDFDVEAFLKDKVKASDPVDGDLEYKLSDVEIDGPGEYKVKVTAKDANENTTIKEIVIVLNEKKEENPADKPTANNPGNSGNSGSSGNSGNSGNSSKPGNSGNSNKPSKPAEKPKEPNKPAEKPSGGNSSGPSAGWTTPTHTPPAGLPSGSTAIGETVGEGKDNYATKYSYSKSLPSGAKIVSYSYHVGKKRIIMGLEKPGTTGNSYTLLANEPYSFSSYATFDQIATQDDLYALADLAQEIWAAYGASHDW